MNQDQDRQFMKMAIELAKRGTGFVNPNPLVGAVLVMNGRIIAKGYHQRYGELHAERNALLSCKASPEGATLYVTLEPCSHYGKTPPCTEAIIEAKISRVVIGSEDPNPLVAGRGIAQLKAAGIQVETGVLKAECDEMNDIFFHFITKERPFVIMKYAMTADGKIATAGGFSRWITSEEARRHVHETRKRTAAIMVGIQTVLKDDPLLNCRLEIPSDPIRIICDSDLRIPVNSAIVKTAEQIPTYVAAVNISREKKRILIDKGLHVIQTKSRQGHVDLNHLMEILGEMKIDSVLLEGGSALNFSALQSGIVSKVQAYIAPKIFGGAQTKSPVGGKGVLHVEDCFTLSKPKITLIGEDILLEYRVINKLERKKSDGLENKGADRFERNVADRLERKGSNRKEDS